MSKNPPPHRLNQALTPPHPCPLTPSTHTPDTASQGQKLRINGADAGGVRTQQEVFSLCPDPLLEDTAVQAGPQWPASLVMERDRGLCWRQGTCPGWRLAMSAF